MHILRVEHPLAPGLRWMENRQDGQRYPVWIYSAATREEYEAYQASIDGPPRRLPPAPWPYFYHASVD